MAKFIIKSANKNFKINFDYIYFGTFYNKKVRFEVWSLFVNQDDMSIKSYFLVHGGEHLYILIGTAKESITLETVQENIKKILNN